MAFNPATVTQDDIVDVGTNKAYPFFQWVSRSMSGPLAKGGWLFKSDQFTGDFVVPGAPTGVQIVNGPDLMGYTYQGLHAAILGVRQDWYFQDIDVSNKKHFAPSYDAAVDLAGGRVQKVKGRTQIMALVKQFAPWYGPVLLTASGVIGRTLDTIVKQEWSNKFVLPAARLYKLDTLPLWMFWAPITTTGVEVRANPKYSSMVIYPKLVLPPEVTTETVDKAYIGDELVARVRALLPEVREWMEARITSSNGEPAAQAKSDGPDWGAPAGPASGGAPGKQATFQRPTDDDTPVWG